MDKNKLFYYLVKGLVNSDNIVIDYGCEKGEWALFLADGVRKVIGMDRNSDLIKIATENNKLKNVYFVKENIDQVPELPRSDVSVAINILKTLRFPDSFLGKLKMSTKKLIILAEAYLPEDNEWKQFGDLKLAETFLTIYERI